MLDKAGEEQIIPPLPATVDHANKALEDKKLIQFLYACWKAHSEDNNRMPSLNVLISAHLSKFERKDFVSFSHLKSGVPKVSTLKVVLT
jgi:hypothetical protein